MAGAECTQVIVLKQTLVSVNHNTTSRIFIERNLLISMGNVSLVNVFPPAN